MTMRERMLAVVHGKPHDRVPLVQYSGLAAPDSEIWAVIGRENMGLLAWTGLHRFDTPNCRFVSEDFERNGRNGLRTRLITPEGDLFEERLIEPTYGTGSVRAHYVKETDDYRVLMAYFRDMSVHKNLDGFWNTVRAMGDDGLPHTAVARTPYQQLWVQWVSLADLGVHLAMEPELMEEVIALMEDVQRRTFEVVCEAVREGAPVPYIDVPDNITAPAIGVEYFEKYCVKAYNELAAMLNETGKDVPVFVHMDGDIKPLWASITKSSVRGIDSLSPKPDNDTTVGEAFANWPYMSVCPNFPSSMHLAEPAAIFEQARQMLEQGAHTNRLQIQVSENVPPDRWRVSYPEIVRAIRSFARTKG